MPELHDEYGGVNYVPDCMLTTEARPGIDALLSIFRLSCTGCDRAQEYQIIAGETLQREYGIDANEWVRRK